jgi:hypothetical protein
MKQDCLTRINRIRKESRNGHSNIVHHPDTAKDYAMRLRKRSTALFIAAMTLSGCGMPLENRSLPLRDLEYSSAAVQEPDDETVRQRLDPGCFSGMTLTQHVAGNLNDALEGDLGALPVQVVAVAEHSPADLAGLRPLDVLVASQIDGQTRIEITHTGQWRQFEQMSQPGTVVSVWYKRLGEIKTTTMTLSKRARLENRIPIRVLTEDQRVGVCVRTLTEVESRRHHMIAGYGVVVLEIGRASCRERV